MERIEITNIKAFQKAGQRLLRVLGVPFGSETDKDAHGDFFSPKTNLFIDLDGSQRIPVVYNHGYLQGKEQQPIPEVIGQAKVDRIDRRGVWFEVLLDDSKSFAERIWQAVKDGIAFASTGSIPGLIRRAANGELLSWPVGEISLLDAVEGRRPANWAAVVNLKAVYQDAGIPMPESFKTLPADHEQALQEAREQGYREGQADQAEEIRRERFPIELRQSMQELHDLWLLHEPENGETPTVPKSGIVKAQWMPALKTKGNAKYVSAPRLFGWAPQMLTPEGRAELRRNYHVNGADGPMGDYGLMVRSAKFYLQPLLRELQRWQELERWAEAVIVEGQEMDPPDWWLSELRENLELQQREEKRRFGEMPEDEPGKFSPVPGAGEQVEIRQPVVDGESIYRDEQDYIESKRRQERQEKQDAWKDEILSDSE